MPCCPRATTSTGRLPSRNQHIRSTYEHRRRVGIALENRKSLRARIVDARHAADHLAEATLQHLLLGAQKTFLVASAIADPKLALRGVQGIEDLVRLAQRKSDRLL